MTKRTAIKNGYVYYIDLYIGDGRCHRRFYKTFTGLCKKYIEFKNLCDIDPKKRYLQVFNLSTGHRIFFSEFDDNYPTIDIIRTIMSHYNAEVKKSETRQ